MSAMDPGHDASFIENVWYYAPIGAAAAIARALLSEDKYSWGWTIRRTIAASITAVIFGPALEGYCSSSGVLLACVGAISYAGPEVWDGVMRACKKGINMLLDKISRAGK